MTRRLEKLVGFVMLMAGLIMLALAHLTPPLDHPAPLESEQEARERLR